MSEELYKINLAEMAIKQVKDALMKQLKNVKDAEGHPVLPEVEEALGNFEKHISVIIKTLPHDQWGGLIGILVEQVNLKLLNGKLTPAQTDALKLALDALVKAFIGFSQIMGSLTHSDLLKVAPEAPQPTPPAPVAEPAPKKVEETAPEAPVDVQPE